MRILNTVQRIILLLVLIPVAAICLNVVLTALGAQRENPIVSAVHRTANFFILEPFRDVFANQDYVQDAVIALIGYAVFAALIVALFRGLRSIATANRARAATSRRHERDANSDTRSSS